MRCIQHQCVAMTTIFSGISLKGTTSHYWWLALYKFTTQNRKGDSCNNNETQARHCPPNLHRPTNLLQRQRCYWGLLGALLSCKRQEREREREKRSIINKSYETLMAKYLPSLLIFKYKIIQQLQLFPFSTLDLLTIELFSSPFHHTTILTRYFPDKNTY